MHPHPLRPLRISDLLDAAIRLYRAHFLRLISIGAVVLLPVAILQLLLASTPLSQLLTTIQNLFLVTLISSALTAASIASYWRQSLSVAQAYRQGYGRYRSLLGAAVLEGLVMLVPLVVVGGAIALVGYFLGGETPIIIGLLVLGVLPIVLFFSTKYVVTFPAILVEGLGASSAMSRSWQLTEKRFWHAFGVVLTSSVLTFLIGQAPALGLVYFNQLTSTATSTTWVPIASTLITQVSLLLTLPFQYLVATCLYYDLRVRNEGFDLELAVQGAAGQVLETQVSQRSS